MTVIFFLMVSAAALTLDTPLADATQEARAKALFHDIRCVVCAGETIADSQAEVAHDMRRVIRNRIGAGDSDASIKAYLVSRYGNEVLMKTPLKPSTWPLWFGPFFLLALALWLARRCFVKRPA